MFNSSIINADQRNVDCARTVAHVIDEIVPEKGHTEKKKKKTLPTCLSVRRVRLPK